jgi:hypothetical protein
MYAKLRRVGKAKRAHHLQYTQERWARRKRAFAHPTELIMSAPLTIGIEQRITILFGPNDIERVSSLLTDECGPNLTEYPELLERIRIAILKLSHGDLDALGRAIDLAKRDWRDVLVAAGFADDVNTHGSWWPDYPIVTRT